MRKNPKSTWNVETGYQTNGNASTVYPYREMGATLWYGSFETRKNHINHICIFRHCLHVITNIILDNTFKQCQFFTPGFLISVHAPTELPRFSNDFVFVPYEQFATILIKPTMMITSEGLRIYAPDVRNCYFRSERKLRFFKSYSKKKCEIECLANFTRNELGCVRFYMPSKHVNLNRSYQFFKIIRLNLFCRR